MTTPTKGPNRADPNTMTRRQAMRLGLCTTAGLLLADRLNPRRRGVRPGKSQSSDPDMAVGRPGSH